ncbi:hypothetical protein JAAARDRAFT_582422 [Jaapia argillacea MUCL 33604]|uniref:Histone deacetylase domain-containing protein n=1 Tax=Jaapia argillacea MUCL 33604 TaxID=933084 RepID=A0A067P6K4_9AGAM|nr:hypothetical protein JAAARDRAFT_582422 [Jaapia argillacea MUCL 33604]
MEKPSSTSGSLLRSGTAVYLQEACLEHRYIRSRDTTNIVERPERIRAVKIGLAAAIARLEFSGRLLPDTHESIGQSQANNTSAPVDPSPNPDELVAALGRLNIGIAPLKASLADKKHSLPVIKSSKAVNLLNDPAVKFVHGDIDGDIYLEKLVKWARESSDKVNNGESEIPEGLAQGDLYLCPESINAIQGAIGTVCEAVDTVIQSTGPSGLLETSGGVNDVGLGHAFVAVRPPGHHCGEDSPSGFCFVNNVAVGAVHAHLQHGINRVVIFDIDLHHGNGTQSIVWQINEETYRKTLESEYSPGDKPPSKPGLQIYYGSIHDILSYPCEDGKMELVQAASVSIHGAHGQHIENIHLQPYTSDEHFFDVLYHDSYSRLFAKATDFLSTTGGPGDDVLVLISCGFDACEHEYPSMSRHNRKVPTSFYHRFAKDACTFADKFARGRVVSVLEGGYSDRALTSGAMAHLSGLAIGGGAKVDETWWSVENLIQLEKATKKRKGGKQSLPGPNASGPEPWLERTLEIFSIMDAGSQYMTPSSSRASVPPSTRTLRERKPQSQLANESADPSPSTSPAKKPKGASKGRKSKGSEVVKVEDVDVELLNAGVTDGSVSSKSDGEAAAEVKKLPRVILRVNPPPGHDVA